MISNLKSRLNDGVLELLDPVTGAILLRVDAVGQTITVPTGITFTADGIGSVLVSQLSDASANGRSLITAANYSAMRTLLGLGTAALLASSTDGTLAANSDSTIATQKAVKTYIDGIVTGLLELKGSTDASTNPNYPSASKGDAYVVTGAGRVGGGSGKVVEVSDMVVAIADNAGGTEASVGTSWIVLEHNLIGALLQSDLANASDVNGGSSTTKVVTPDALAGSSIGERVVQVEVFSPTTDCATGDGKRYFVVPAPLNGMNLVGIHGRSITAGTTGTMDVQVANVTDSVDMLSTKLTWDSTEAGTDTAATPAVIDTSHDDVATNDLLRIDVDAVQSTAAKGMIVTLRFQLP